MRLSSFSAYKRLFIIDDDVEDQEILIEAIKEVDSAVQCYCSTSGEDALKQLEREILLLPDLIFLDMNMPRLNGKQVLTAIKDRKTLQQIPVIMYSTSFAPHDIEDLRKLGAVYYLLKPSNFHDLCRSLGFILQTDWSRG